jgi:hypothetical protein
MPGILFQSSNDKNMSQKIKPFNLRGLILSAGSALAPSEDLPGEVAGQPVSYFWKDLIHAGNYLHPSKEFSLVVDQDRLKRWTDTGREMIDAGVAIPINCDHSDAARDVLGYVKEFKLDGDRLLGLCQFIGEDAALMAARNLVSIGIDPDFVDGEAREWGEAVVHLALTPVPVVQDQDQFVQLPVADCQLLNEGKVAALACTAEQFQTLCELIGRPVSADDCVARIIEQLREADEADSSVVETSSAEAGPDLKIDLAMAREEILRLSSRLPPSMPVEAQAAIAEAATGKFDAAVARGVLSPGARDQLVATLVQGGDGRGNVMTLSRAANPSGDRCLAMAIAEILLDSEPVPLGERTGLQAMSRQVPGEESSSMDYLRNYMTKIASVAG